MSKRLAIWTVLKGLDQPSNIATSASVMQNKSEEFHLLGLCEETNSFLLPSLFLSLVNYMQCNGDILADSLLAGDRRLLISNSGSGSCIGAAVVSASVVCLSGPSCAIHTRTCWISLG